MQDYSLPAKRLTPRIANIKKTTMTTIPTLNIAPIDESKATTTVFIEELWEINLRGLRIRKSLRILMIGRFTLVNKASIKDVATIKLSS